MTRSDRHGFTLIELLVALLVGATIVLGARLMLEGVADDARRVSYLARRADHEANAERVLRATVAAIDVSSAFAQPFEGDERTVRFTSWCARPGGWQERCAATIALSGDSTATALVLTRSGSTPLHVRDDLTRAELRYLSDARDGGRWVHRWSAGLVPPLAIGVVFGPDTLTLAIGERG